MGGQIVYATIVATRRGVTPKRSVPPIKVARVAEGWARKPAKLRQKDGDARWTVKFSKAKLRGADAPQVDLAVPAFGEKNHISIDHWYGLIRGWTATHAAAHEGTRWATVLAMPRTRPATCGPTPGAGHDIPRDRRRSGQSRGASQHGPAGKDRNCSEPHSARAQPRLFATVHKRLSW